MTKVELNEKLKKIGISKVQLAKELDITVGAVNNWGGIQAVPSWVAIFLDKYEKASAYDLIKNKVLEVENKKS